jgi:ribosomal-protein-alanine N-acetyltransferase
MKISLRAFELSDLMLLNAWHNDANINALTGGQQYFVSSEYDKKWIEDKIFNNQKHVYCMICNTSWAVGYISLTDINWVNRTANWGGVIIDPQHREKGAATQAALQMLEYGFFELGLQKITGKWLIENTVSIFMAKILGFVQEGVLRKDVFKGGQFHDIIIMSMLKEEFIEKYKDEK